MAWIDDQGTDTIPRDQLARLQYLGEVSTPELDEATRAGPQAHLAVQGAETTPLPVHFHTVDQFQYFAHGKGTVGRHRVATGVVHYTDRLTPYGPLRPGLDGMSYVTLRARHDGGVRYMPESRDALRALMADSDRGWSGRRNVAIDLTANLASEPAEDGEEPESDGWRTLREDPDGLRVAVVDLAARQEAAVRAEGAGGYVTVVTGTVEDGDLDRRPGSIRWVPAGSRTSVRIGSQPTRLALLQYPVGHSPTG